jgi:hypothetical protein
MLRVIANHANNAFPVNDLALIADLFDRWSYLHNLYPPLLVAIRDSPAFQIVGRKFDEDLVAR